MVWATGLALLALIDQETLVLPTKLVRICVLVLSCLVVEAAVTTGYWGYLGRSAPCALVALAGYSAWAFLRPNSLGLGDARMACLVAFGAGIVSPAGCIVALTSAPAAAAGVSAFRRSPAALGPFWRSPEYRWWWQVRSEQATLPNDASDHAGGTSLEVSHSRSPSRLTAGSVVPVLLAVLAAGFAYAALQDRSSMTSIVVSSSMVPAGAAVNSHDTRTVRVHSSDTALAQGLLTPSQLGDGLVATVAVQPGEPVTLSEVEKPSLVPALGEMSIAVPLQQAAGGRIGAGDLVDVIGANGTGGAYYVAQGLRVLGVAPASSSSGVLGGGAGGYFVVVAVDKQTALRIAGALGSDGSGGTGNDIEIIRSTGEAPTANARYEMPAPTHPGPNLGNEDRTR